MPGVKTLSRTEECSEFLFLHFIIMWHAMQSQVGQNAERGRSTTGIREWVWFFFVQVYHV